jgi:hypothetical protein
VPLPQLPPALAALLDAARAIARSSTTYRLLDPERAPDPIPGKDVEKALRDAWGRPAAKVLDDLDAEPARVGPVSQVHRGELDGDAVAVEVLRPGIASAVRNDLALLDALVAPASAAFPRVDVRGMLREARERTMDELDLEHRASTQRAVRRALRGEDRVEVPAPHADLATPTTLVDAWLDGAPSAGDAAAATTLLDASLRLAARTGWVLVDHRPEHVLDLGGGRLGLLNTGAAVRADRERLAGFAAALRGLLEDDPAPLAGLGVVSDHERAHAVARAVAAPLLGATFRLDLRLLEQLAGRAADQGAFALAPLATPQPRDMWPGRGAGQLVLTLATWGVEADWLALAADALEDA